MLLQRPPVIVHLHHPEIPKLWKYQLTCQWCFRTFLVPPGLDQWYHGGVTQGQSPQDSVGLRRKTSAPTAAADISEPGEAADDGLEPGKAAGDGLEPDGLEPDGLEPDGLEPGKDGYERFFGL